MRKFFLTFFASLALFAGPALAEKPQIYLDGGGVFSSGWTHAVDGYDVVSYQSEGGPVMGDDAFEATYNGAKFRFSTAENLAAFEADPEKYAPQFGGYCAYAVSEGYTAKGDPEAWTVHDGKLYLNYSKSVRKTWLKDRDARITQANANWPSVLN